MVFLGFLLLVYYWGIFCSFIGEFYGKRRPVFGELLHKFTIFCKCFTEKKCTGNLS